MKLSIAPVVLTTFLIPALSTPAAAADWPMWRHDAGRTAFTREELPAQLHPQWIRQYGQREPVWDDPLNQDLMPLDRVFEPIVLGDTLYMGFNDRDKVVALDTRTGVEKWTFYADGPVRLPLAGSRNRVYFTSDDGHLYCLAADTGKLLWKFRGGPAERKILGNKRLISSWPARGGVALYGNAVYFAASIWPLMGTFIYALDAENGSILWRNEGAGADYQNQPHNAPAFAGVAPQGAIAALADRLLISGGRSVPACFDRRTGKLLYYHLATYNKTGGAFVAANERHFFNHYRDRDTDLYDVETGKVLAKKTGKHPVLAGDAYYTSGDTVGILDPQQPAKPQFTLAVDASGDLIGAGSRLYAGGDGQIAAIDVAPGAEPKTRTLKTAWVEKVKGKVERLVAANGMLFAVTLDGKLIAFGKERVDVRTHVAPGEAPPVSPAAAEQARAILGQTGAKNGYALVYGGSADGLAALALASDLDLVAVEPAAAKVPELRRWFDKRGLLGKRVHVLEGTPDTFRAPPYMASLVVLADGPGSWKDESLKSMVRSVRPYGGKIWLPLEAASPAFLEKLIASTDGPKISARKLASSVVASKDGPLPGAANWTHQYGDVANTVKSDDGLVKLPLGVLWFGGVSNIDVLPRHGHGPPEQIVDGRLIIEGVDSISARDVYTGRMLWKAPLDKSHTFGQYYDESLQDLPLTVITNQVHIPGANARGTNFVATPDWVYILQGSICQALDIATGEKKKAFSLPAEGGAEQPQWGYIGVSGDRLIAGRDFVSFATAFPQTAVSSEQSATLSEKERTKLRLFGGYDATASRSLVVMDRHGGSVKWTLKARYGFIHNAITASEGVLFCLDKLPPALEKRLERRGLQPPADYRMLAVDMETGRILWEKGAGVFGSWLSYSREHDRILQATRPSRDMVTDEPGERMAVYVASTGALVWDKPVKYANPPILRHDEIITDNAAYKLATGDRRLTIDPVSGEEMPWSYSRAYGCNYNIASEHLLSFRSAAAGFYDLVSEGGTGNLGGFKSGCTSNLIAAGGVLNAPDYTRTCQCSYQNQTSLAFIHMPELEYWTTNDFKWNGKRVSRVGINLNAPGDRVAHDGTLWLDYPSVGGKSPDLPIEFEAANTRPVRRHALTLQPNGHEWVAASGLAGPLKLNITLSGKPVSTARYTVKLHFAELEDKKPGERIFHVRLQGRDVLSGFDIAKAAGGVDRPVVKTFSGIPVSDTLTVECLPDSAGAPPLLSGIEVILEK